MKSKPVIFRTAFLYLGAVIGAGFASGRENWQYFGIFGEDAYKGILVATGLFVFMGTATTYIAGKLKTTDMGKIVLPVRSEKASHILGWIFAIMIYNALISMSAAGGSLLNQLTGAPAAAGGAAVVFLVIVTVLGDFERVSGVFGYVVPLLFAAVAGVCIYVAVFFEPTGEPITTKPSAMASTWYVSAAVYVAYNIMGTIPINASSAIRSGSRRKSTAGAALGGLGLGVLGLALTTALLKDPSVSDNLDLPMLGFAQEINSPAGWLFAIVLLVSIYSSATGTYYGFCCKLKNDDRKKYKVVFFAVLGFALGLCGFRNIVTYVYPVMGYAGFVVIILTAFNFIRILIELGKGKFEDEQDCKYGLH